MAKRLNRISPNILIVGTPATGKTSIADQVSLRTGLRHINVGHYAVDHKFIEGYLFLIVFTLLLFIFNSNFSTFFNIDTMMNLVVRFSMRIVFWMH